LGWLSARMSAVLCSAMTAALMARRLREGERGNEQYKRKDESAHG
jgi:hypothetical protein